MKLWGNENMLNLGGIGTIYTWISCVSIQLPCRGMATFVPDSLFKDICMVNSLGK